MQNQNQVKTKKDENDSQRKFIEDLVAEVQNDFLSRQKQRLSLERQWELNLNFLIGNQYSKINRRGEIDQVDSEYSWQEREVFNHVAPIMETRLAKFSRISTNVCVRPSSDDDKDVSGADYAEKLLAEVFKKTHIDDIVKKVTVYSETCGTGFYKILWNNGGGDIIGKLADNDVHEGCAEILAISPFEIFPDSLYKEELCDCESVIHARAVNVDEIYRKYGVRVLGEDINTINLSTVSSVASFGVSPLKGVVSNSAIVIEKYIRPTGEFPNGRLITVAGDKLLYYGELPYLCGTDKKRDFPFVKQQCLYKPNNFFGLSIIERLIPVQRAYNAVKNRKHEFLNRLSMGVLTVEDGSVDVDDLADAGLSPGKIVVYRQGSNPPKILNDITMPSEFSLEEEKLLKEFVSISGVSDVSSAEKNASASGATALKLLIEQDNERMVSYAEKIRKSFVQVAKKVLRLYAQFTAGVKAVKCLDGREKTKVVYVDQSAWRSDDIYLENDNELLHSMTERKETVYRLYESGILNNDTGKIDEDVKTKILSVLGYKDLDCRKGICRLQEERAQNENEKIRKSVCDIEEIDDDDIHVLEHTRYVLGEYDELDQKQKERFNSHIKAHKDRIESAKQNNQIL